MNVGIKGTKSETITVSVTIIDFLITLNGFLKKEDSQWIAKSEKEPGKLALWSDHGGSHYYQGEDRILTDTEVEYHNACEVIEKHLMAMNFANKRHIFSKEDELELTKSTGKSKKA